MQQIAQPNCVTVTEPPLVRPFFFFLSKDFYGSETSWREFHVESERFWTYYTVRTWY
eukprot:SAG11_NODE_3678_length_2292_cov_3.587779_4_plen_57_part_00